MEFDSIQKIVEAEKEAELIKKRAEEEAKDILEKAELTKKKNKVYFKGQLESKLKDLQKEEQEKNELKITNIKAVSSERIRKLKNQLEGNIDKATDKIYEKVIKI